MRIKIIIPFIITIAFLTVLFFGATEKEPSLKEILQDRLNAYETDLRDSLVSMKTNEDIESYLLTWADNKKIAAVSDASGNIIYNIPASAKADADAQPTAILCSYDASSMESYIEEISVALTIAKCADNNGNLQIIFLSENQLKKIGAKALDTSDFAENTAVFCLGKTADSRLSSITGGYQHIQISNKIHYSEPSYNKAYKIEVKNCPEHPLSEIYEPGLNPIKRLGSDLASFKSSALLFELSSFKGGKNVLTVPSSASMTVVIDAGDMADFEKKMDSSIEKFYEKYCEEYPGIVYTYEETELPARVFSRKDTDNLVSLMYTIFNGIYNRNEKGTITSLTNIGSVNVTDGRLKIDTAVMCSDSEIMDEISEVYETICGLCDMKFKVQEQVPIYNGANNEKTKELMESFRHTYSKYSGRKIAEESTAVLTACSYLHEKNPGIPVIYCGILSKNRIDMAASIITWLNQPAATKK